MGKVIELIPRERCYTDKSLIDYAEQSLKTRDRVLDRHLKKCGSCADVFLEAIKKNRLKPV